MRESDDESGQKGSEYIPQVVDISSDEEEDGVLVDVGSDAQDETPVTQGEEGDQQNTTAETPVTVPQESANSPSRERELYGDSVGGSLGDASSTLKVPSVSPKPSDSSDPSESKIETVPGSGTDGGGSLDTSKGGPPPPPPLSQIVQVEEKASSTEPYKLVSRGVF